MADGQVFSGPRLVLARHRRRFAASELAVRVGVNAKTVGRWEREEKEPEPANLDKLSRVLEFPLGFFFGDAPTLLAQEKFRALARMTEKERMSVRAAGAQAVDLDNWIGRRFERPAPDVPDLRDVRAADAADQLRAAWGLGLHPIPNAVHLLERHGVRVYSLVHEGDEIDAFSVWQGSVPFVFVNTVKTAERSRMDVLHELCHLTMHGHTNGPGDKDQEREAQEFASSLLMPTIPFLASKPQKISLPAVIEAKQVWGVSALAYVYRLHRLGQISDWQYKSLMIEIKSNYPRAEPGPLRAIENSQVLAKIFATGVSRREIVRDLRIRMQDFDEMTFGLALTPVSGGAPGQPQSPPAPIPGGGLRLVQ